MSDTATPPPPAAGGGPDFNSLLAQQSSAQAGFLNFQTASQNLQLAFQTEREAMQFKETLLEAGLDESEKYRSNISQAQA